MIGLYEGLKLIFALVLMTILIGSRFSVQAVFRASLRETVRIYFFVCCFVAFWSAVGIWIVSPVLTWWIN